MCTFSNEFAVVILKENMFMLENKNKVGGKLSNLLEKYVDIYKDMQHISREDGVVHVYIMFGRFANSVVREALSSEINEGLVAVSSSPEDAHKQIEKRFPQYEFLNPGKVMETFMENMSSCHAVQN